MNSHRFFQPWIVLFIVGALAALAPAARAASVNATISERTSTVGDTLQYQIQIDDDSGRDLEPPDITVEGLDIRYLGPSTNRRVEFTNGRFSQSNTTTLIYQVTPSKPGNFTIPAVVVEVGGQRLQTRPVAFKVEKNTGSVSDGESKIAFSEIDPFKRELYVGEIVPVEINFYLDARIQAELEQMPDLAGEGFTKGKPDEPRQQQARRDGVEWKVVTFRWLVTPSKAGKITLGPADVPFVAEVPRQRRRSRDPFDSFFNDPFFDRALAERKRYNARAPAVELNVKPLPVAGRPASFSGAIGQFKFAASGSPNHFKVGDPITMRLTVSGKGNFDRMQAPSLVDSQGWHAYPASGNFEPAANSEIEGTKTFEMPVVPETAHQKMPQFQFTYFDPDQGKYAALKSEPAPLTVDNAPAPAAVPSSPAAAESPPAPKVDPETQAPAESGSNFRGLVYETGPRESSFTPLFRQRAFYAAQLVPFGILLALIAVRVMRRDPRVSRDAEWRRERDHLRHTMRRTTDAAEFYETAARAVQIQTALRTGVNPASVDADVVRARYRLDEQSTADVNEIFNARAELLYAGAGPAAHSIPPSDRERVLAAVERLLSSHA
ncbi:MAG: BatD family protein [Chthoniobacteraceae bacterium]